MTDRLELTGAIAALPRWFDGQFRAMAIGAGASEWTFPPTIAASTLTRAGFFESFPGGATAVGSGRGQTGGFLPPAVCYHAYATLAGRRIAEPLLLTAAQTCYRDADRASSDDARLWEFTMREIVFIGSADWVAEQRRAWTARALAFAGRLELAGAIEPATDPFFGDLSRGRRLMQQLKHLKDELRLTLGARTVAAASFNMHDTFFGSRFGLTIGDGSVAHSGCAAFGLERWTLALLAQRGERAAEDILKG
jgi:seryl-tRNA synthetase